jgi:hypothetical protein
MRFIWHALAFYVLAGCGLQIYAQPMDSETLNRYIRDFSQVGSDEVTAFDISGFADKLKQKESPRNSTRFCRLLFNRTHQEFFRRYSQFASFSETLNRGKYNCLTGTALYALLLNHFDIAYTIIETNYHIFLLAETDDGQVLFEATDPINGFVTDAKEIARMIDHYKKNIPLGVPLDGKRYYMFTSELYQPVGLSELRGLLHYNVSTNAYNNQDFESAIKHLDRAIDLYSSPRVAEFSTVLLGAVLQSRIDGSTRDRYINQLKGIRKKLPVMASR